MADINDLANEVANLTTATTNLVDEVVGQKERLEDLNTQAQTQATLATTKAGEASTSEVAAEAAQTAAEAAALAALGHRDSAQTLVDQATTITGLETVNDAVSQALADGGYTWRTEADMKAMREVNNEMLAASGFVHMGRHWFNSNNGEVAINEGLQTYTITPQILYSGVQSDYISSTPKGNSRTFEPIVNLGGFITHIEYLGVASQTKAMTYKFPDVEAGTRTYDTATGVSIDYAKEVDPKYGDVAPDVNEAVARAFEGIVENGDMRLGDTSWSSILTTKSIVNGALRVTAEAGSVGHRIAQRNDSNLYPMQSGVSYIVECNVRKGTYGVVHFLHSCDKNLNSVSEYPRVSVPLVDGYNRFIITPEFTGDESFAGYGFQGMDGIVGQDNYFDVEYMSVRPVTTEVVTDRVDMFGIEGWLEKVTLENPFVYHHGIIQSNAQTLEGITTTNSNRPNSYYAVFDGDTTSRGKGVDFFALSVIEQDQIANNPKHNIYRMSNGDIVQWRIRQRTIAGLGNGNWINVDSTSTKTMRAEDGYTLNNVPTLQGRRDTYLSGKLWNTEAGSYEGKPSAYGNGFENDKPGAFVSYYSRTNSYSEHDIPCYFLVCGLVSRLNKGGYHPSLNPNGANPWKIEDSTNHGKWYVYKSMGKKAQSVRDAFDSQTFVGDFSKIGQTNSSLIGRLDSHQFYNAIYADQVCDMRMSAAGVTDFRKSLIDAVRSDITGVTRSKGVVPFTAIVPVPDANLVRYGSASQIRTSSDANDTDLSRNPHLTRALEQYVGDDWIGNLSQILSNEAGAVAAAATLAGKYSSYLCFDVVGESFNRVYRMKGATYGTDVCGLEPIGSTPELEASVTPVSGSTFIMWCLGDHMGSNSPEISRLVKSKASMPYNMISQIDVVGEPSKIVDLFPYGFTGQWLPYSYSGSVNYNNLPLNRKANGTDVSVLYYDINNSMWTYRTMPIDVITNTPSWGGAVNGLIELWHYDSLSDLTESDSNGEVMGDIGDVVVLNHRSIDKGNRLFPSLISKIGVVGKGEFNSASTEFLPMTSYQIGTTYPNKLETATTVPHKHAPISDSLSSINGTNSVKALPHLVEENGQLFVQYHATQLIHNGTDWGDNAKVKIVDGETTQTDLNGNTVKVVTHTSQYPIGWVKNEI